MKVLIQRFTAERLETIFDRWLSNVESKIFIIGDRAIITLVYKISKVFCFLGKLHRFLLISTRWFRICCQFFRNRSGFFFRQRNVKKLFLTTKCEIILKTSDFWIIQKIQCLLLIIFIFYCWYKRFLTNHLTKESSFLVFCSDISGILKGLGLQNYDPKEWRLFIDSSKRS